MDEALAWRGFLTKVWATFGTRGFLLVLTFISSVITSRYLGPEGRGVYAVLASISAIGVQFGNFGLHAANTFFLGQNRSLRGQILSNSAWISAGFGAALTGILVVVQRFIWTPADQPLWIYYAAIIGIPFALFYVLALNVWLGLGRIASFNVMEIVGSVAGFVAVLVCLVSFRWGAASLIVYSTAFNAVAAAVLFIALRDPEKRGFDISLFTKMFRYGIKAYVAAIFAFLVLRFDLLMVNRMIGTEAAGIYSIAVQIGDVLYLIPASIGLVLFPHISAMKSGTWAFTKKAARMTGAVLGACSIVVWLAGPSLIELAYGSQFRESANALRWLLPGIWMLGVNSVFMNYLAGSGMPLITVISPAIAFCVNIGLNFALIPTMGISGAALASTVAYSIMLVCSAVYLLSYRRPAQ